MTLSQKYGRNRPEKFSRTSHTTIVWTPPPLYAYDSFPLFKFLLLSRTECSISSNKLVLPKCITFTYSLSKNYCNTSLYSLCSSIHLHSGGDTKEDRELNEMLDNLKKRLASAAIKQSAVHKDTEETQIFKAFPNNTIDLRTLISSNQ